MQFDAVTIWFGILILLLLAEAVSVALISAWFALGALGALICAVIAPELVWLQILVFIIISGVSLYFTRPLAAKYLNSNRKATNADRLIGTAGVVREPIDNMSAKGTVFISGKLWTARSDFGEEIAEGVIVKVNRIEGVKLIVTPVTEKEKTKI